MAFFVNFSRGASTVVVWVSLMGKCFREEENVQRPTSNVQCRSQKESLFDIRRSQGESSFLNLLVGISLGFGFWNLGFPRLTTAGFGRNRGGFARCRRRLSRLRRRAWLGCCRRHDRRHPGPSRRRARWRL